MRCFLSFLGLYYFIHATHNSEVKYYASFYIDKSLQKSLIKPQFLRILKEVRGKLKKAHINFKALTIKYVDIKYKPSSNHLLSKKLLADISERHKNSKKDRKANIIFYILKRHRNSTLRGLTYINSAHLIGNNFGILYLTENFGGTIVHEILHTLNVKHTEKKSIMNKKYNHKTDFISDDTIESIDKYLAATRKNISQSLPG